MTRFNQLLRLQIAPDRYIVVSETSDGKISLAQQLKVKDNGGKDIFLFLKNAVLMEKNDFKKFREQLVAVSLSRPGE